MGFSVDFRTVDQSVQVGPHKFVGIGVIFNSQKCRACYLPPEAHPTIDWTPARPLGDKR